MCAPPAYQVYPILHSQVPDGASPGDQLVQQERSHAHIPRGPEERDCVHEPAGLGRSPRLPGHGCGAGPCLMVQGAGSRGEDTHAVDCGVQAGLFQGRPVLAGFYPSS